MISGGPINVNFRGDEPSYRERRENNHSTKIITIITAAKAARTIILATPETTLYAPGRRLKLH